jgi:hypothetical protein
MGIVPTLSSAEGCGFFLQTTTTTTMNAQEMREAIALRKNMRRKQQRAKTGEGEAAIEGVFMCFHITVTDPATGSKKSATTTIPPKSVMIESKKEPGKKWPAKLVTWVTLSKIGFVPGIVEPRDDGAPGYKLFMELGFHGDAERWLLNNYKAFYSGEMSASITSKVPVSEYISETGELATHRWVNVHAEQSVKIKVDGTKNSIFRRRNQDKNGYEIRTVTPMRFPKISMSQYVAMRKPFKPKKKKKEEEAAEGDAIKLVPSESVPEGADDVDATEGALPQGYISFTCNGDPLPSDDFDPTLPETEKLKLIGNYNAHQLIPYSAFIRGDAYKPTVSFYLRDNYTTPRDQLPDSQEGITMALMDPNEDEMGGGANDFKRTYQQEVTPKRVIRALVYQWKGEPSMQNEYSIIFNCWDDMWMNYGILDQVIYGMVMQRNYDIPCHVGGNIWMKDTKSFDSNRPAGMGGIVKQEDLTLRGTYSFVAKTFVPDMIIYLRDMGGIRVSAERVKKEFKAWKGVTGGRTTMILSPADPKVVNPLHSQGVASPVICLGNGQLENAEAMAVNTDLEPIPTSHFFSGNAWPLMTNSDFYVLTSYRLTDEERAKYCGPNANPKEGDKFLQTLVTGMKVYYVIYALKKNVRTLDMGPKLNALAQIAPQPQVVITPKKNQEEEVEEEEEEEEEEVEAPPPKSRRRSALSAKSRKRR